MPFTLVSATYNTMPKHGKHASHKKSSLKHGKGGGKGRLGDANKLGKRLHHGQQASTVWNRAMQTSRAH